MDRDTARFLIFQRCESSHVLTTTAATVHRFTTTQYELELSALPSSIIDSSFTSRLGGCVPDMCWQVPDSDTDHIIWLFTSTRESLRVLGSTGVCEQKIAAGICGILLGTLGVHKFILGLNTSGAIMLAVSIFGVCLYIPLLGMMTVGIIEGIIYLSKSDEDFYQTYAIQKKEWF